MLQLEMEKAGQQLSGVSQMKHVLAKIPSDLDWKIRLFKIKVSAE
jgi:hypothetical protein